MRTRRLKKHPAALEVSAFINLIVVLVPFLLSTAVFTRLAVVDMKLPAQSTGGPEQTAINQLKLEVIIRKDAIDVDDRIGGRLGHFPDIDGKHDIDGVAAKMLELKNRFPDATEASLLPESNVPYDTLIQVMDVMRSTKVAQGNEAVTVDLFPAISIGDAPVTAAEFAAAHPGSPLAQPAPQPAPAPAPAPKKR